MSVLDDYTTLLLYTRSIIYFDIQKLLHPLMGVVSLKEEYHTHFNMIHYYNKFN